MHRLCIVRIDSFDGSDTFLHCGNDEQEHLFCVINVNDDNSASIVDSAYRSMEEALEAWPEAAENPPAPG